MRPKIGLCGSRADGLQAVNKTYLNAIWQAGGLPVLLPYTEDEEQIKLFAAEFDGFLFCGGVDIDPKYYGEEPSEMLGETCPERDRFEALLFQTIYPLDKPILGICRGEQVINVFLGGTLHQHIEGHIQDGALLPGSRPQTVTLTEEGYLRRLLGIEQMQINSFHHQAVKDMGDGLVVDAMSMDGYIEAYHSEKHPFLLCVQWHPEIYHTDCYTSQDIFRTFVLKCNKKI